MGPASTDCVESGQSPVYAEKPTVFISYARENRDFAIRISQSLEQYGIEVKGDWQLSPGEYYEEQLRTLIIGTDAFVFIISPSSVSSPACQKELDLAGEQRKRVLPVAYQDHGDDEALHSTLRAPQWTFLRSEDDFTDGVRELVNAIKTDFDLLPEHRRLSVAVENWARSARNKEYLFRGEELKSSEEWLTRISASPNRLPQPTAAQSEFILESQRARVTRTRIGSSIAGAVILILVGLTVFAFNQRSTAIQNKGIAEEQRDEAKRQRNIAVARQLAAQAALVRNERASLLERSVLLAMESTRRLASIESDAALRAGLALLAMPKREFTHQGPVSVVRYDPSGSYLATASGHLVKVWDAVTGKELARILHGGRVYSVVFSPAGRQVATAAHDGTARVWDFTSNKEVFRLEHNGPVNAVTYSADGRYIATASDDLTARLWAARSGKKVAILEHRFKVEVVAFSPDGRFLATGGGQVAPSGADSRLWTVPDGKVVARLPHKNPIVAMAFNRVGDYLVTSSGSAARIWKVPTGEKVQNLPHTTVFFATFSPGGPFIATAGNDGTVRVWKKSGEIARLVHQGPVHALAFSPQGQYLATGSNDNTARLWKWQAEGAKEVARFCHEGFVQSVSFSPDGKHVASASQSGRVRIWELANRQSARTFPRNSKTRFSPDGRYMAVPGAPDGWQVSEIVSGKKVSHLRYENQVLSLAISQDERYVATGGFDYSVRIWEAKTGRELLRMDHRRPVDTVAFSPDGRYVASGSRDATALIWDAATGKEVAQVRHKDIVSTVTFSDDGQHVATGSFDRTATVVDVVTGLEVSRVSHPHDVKAVAFSPTGRYFVTASSDKRARVWETKNGKLVVSMEHQFPVLAVTFSSDGRYVATGSSDKTARVWEATSGREVARLHHETAVQAVDFDQDGSRLYTVAGAISRFHLLHPQDLIREGCSRLTRNLTVAEWQQYLAPEPYSKTCPRLPA